MHMYLVNIISIVMGQGPRVSSSCELCFRRQQKVEMPAMMDTQPAPHTQAVLAPFRV